MPSIDDATHRQSPIWTTAERADLITWEADHHQQQFTSIEGASVEDSAFTLEDWFSAGFWAERIHPEDLPFVAEFCGAAIADQQDHRFECRIMRSDGTIEWVENIVSVVVENGETVGLRGSILQIGDRKLHQQQQAAAQTMDAIGRLAGGVAHDFNNLLTVIKTYSELIEYNLEPTDPGTKYVKAIRKAADAAAELTDQLLLFNTQSLGSRSVVGMNDAVTGLDGHLRSTLGIQMGLKLELDSSVGMVRADRERLEQALANMVKNSIEAIDQAGTVTVSTHLIEIKEDSKQLPAGNYAELRVVDDGRGIDPNNLDRVFEPFFTTKDVGAGRGVGLTVVYGIAQQHDGHATITSTLGVGTTVSLLLPLAEPAAEKAPARISAKKMPVGAETILLVEDEEDIRRVANIALTRLGYTVLSAAEPLEALELIENYDEPVHLLVTDVVMPNMYGHELVKKLRPRLPDVRILFTSGYTAETLESELDGGHFLPKPFTLQILATAVRTALDSEPPRT